MRFSLFPLLLAGLLSSAQGQFVSISDDFSNNGSLGGSTPDSGVGNWESNDSDPAISVTGGEALVAAGSGEMVQLNFYDGSGDLSSGTYYYGFSFRVDDSGSISTNNTVQAVTGFRQGTVGSGTYALSFGIFRPSTATQNNSGVPNTSTSQFAVGFFDGASLNGSTNSLTSWGSALDRGTNYRAVISFDLENNGAELWIDPTSSSSSSITLTGITSDTRGIFLRQASGSHGDVYFDDVLVAQSFEGALSAVPEPSTYAAIAGAAMLGFAVYRRRRQQRNSVAAAAA
ncbi:PEP-CTERM sorting domain-containing protein [Actomonas aquatica]|uniref:PEP-CTERM sorting domain-containing protein n=1 Tax=Actomonas aquatica TaxID=2866162 RepID=A0ABZ1C1W4_9BACT|nr:PEP-CTERM sorting domain-containing protein [Opitutus sp. WL0086]WRQ85631.1 PEP-CTERM sorting domain-containing protein [Opitutus sp. WL0086]